MARTTETTQVVRLSRVSINDETIAALANQSRLYHIPIQDLVGGACRMALSFDDSQRQNWHKVAIKLRDARLAAQE